MPFKNVDQLSRTLLKNRLVLPQDLDDCLIQLGPGQHSPEELLRALEHSGRLTSYQVGRIEKDAADELVLGPYKILYRNASGSFARVFRACRISDGETVALKVLRQRWADDPKMVALFHREAEMGRKLKHKNIVPINEVHSDRAFHYFVMEFVQGGNLRDFLQIRGKLSPLEASRYVLDIAQGLAYALAQGVTHRDLKLTNVLLSMDGVAKLIDFGLGGEEAASGSGGGSADGGDGGQRALEYAAIESMPGSRRGDPRSDLFFLGAVYYELLTGVPPWPRTKDRDERRQTSRYTEIRPVQSIDPNIPEAVAAAVEKLLATDANLRYQSAADLSADLRQILADLGDPSAAQADAVKKDADQPVVLCIENRPKHQDVLRNYLGKHGFRVLLLSDAGRGLNRLKTNPPDCVVLMGDVLGEDIGPVFAEATRNGSGRPVVTIAVLAEKQRRLAETLPQSDLARVLVQPLKLRDLREQISHGLTHRDD